MGSMNPEVAMEQYIKLLSDHVPGWTHQNKVVNVSLKKFLLDILLIDFHEMSLLERNSHS